MIFSVISVIIFLGYFGLCAYRCVACVRVLCQNVYHWMSSFCFCKKNGMELHLILLQRYWCCDIDICVLRVCAFLPKSVSLNVIFLFLQEKWNGITFNIASEMLMLLSLDLRYCSYLRPHFHSLSLILGTPFLAVYCASKFATEGFIESIASIARKFNIW